MTLPFELVMPGPPVSQQARRRELVRQWTAIVRNTAGQDWRYLPVSTRELMVTITYLHRGDPIDVDNIPKPILDALKGLVYADDVAVTDLICRKRDLRADPGIDNASTMVSEALRYYASIVHVRVNDAPDQTVF